MLFFPPLPDCGRRENVRRQTRCTENNMARGSVVLSSEEDLSTLLQYLPICIASNRWTHDPPKVVSKSTANTNTAPTTTTTVLPPTSFGRCHDHVILGWEQTNGNVTDGGIVVHVVMAIDRNNNGSDDHLFII
jgi:hypothetical protein